MQILHRNTPSSQEEGLGEAQGESKVRMQRTYNGTSADESALNFLVNLSKCFHIRRVVLKEIKRKDGDWRGKKIRLEVRYE